MSSLFQNSIIYPLIDLESLPKKPEKKTRCDLRLRQLLFVYYKAINTQIPLYARILKQILLLIVVMFDEDTGRLRLFLISAISRL